MKRQSIALQQQMKCDSLKMLVFQLKIYLISVKIVAICGTPTNRNQPLTDILKAPDFKNTSRAFNAQIM